MSDLHDLIYFCRSKEACISLSETMPFCVIWLYFGKIDDIFTKLNNYKNHVKPCPDMVFCDYKAQ